METEDKRFERTLAASWSPVFVVAAYCNWKQFDTWIPGQRLRPTFDKRKGYGDEADFWVRDSRINTPWLPIEVKQRSLVFSSSVNYPYPTIIVDRVQKVEKAQAYAYFILNRICDSAAVIYGDTRPSWTIETKHDRIKGYDETVYICPMEQIVFIDLNESHENRTPAA